MNKYVSFSPPGRFHVQCVPFNSEPIYRHVLCLWLPHFQVFRLLLFLACCHGRLHVNWDTVYFTFKNSLLNHGIWFSTSTVLVGAYRWFQNFNATEINSMQAIKHLDSESGNQNNCTVSKELQWGGVGGSCIMLSILINSTAISQMYNPYTRTHSNYITSDHV